MMGDVGSPPAAGNRPGGLQTRDVACADGRADGTARIRGIVVGVRPGSGVRCARECRGTGRLGRGRSGDRSRSERQEGAGRAQQQETTRAKAISSSNVLVSRHCPHRPWFTEGRCDGPRLRRRSNRRCGPARFPWSEVRTVARRRAAGAVRASDAWKDIRMQEGASTSGRLAERSPSSPEPAPGSVRSWPSSSSNTGRASCWRPGVRTSCKGRPLTAVPAPSP